MKQNKIWIERKKLLDKLENDVNALIKWRIPWYQKYGYWQAIYSCFLKRIIKQDLELDKKLKD
jgi:hypothetical protein